jgi:hypothetical protein
VLAPEQAQASCGDYVMMNGHSAASHDATADQSRLPHRVPGCHGPGCRQNRELPAPPPTRVTLDEHSWGLPPRLVDLAAEASHFFAVSTDPAVARSVAAGIFRPPRSL